MRALYLIMLLGSLALIGAIVLWNTPALADLHHGESSWQRRLYIEPRYTHPPIHYFYTPPPDSYPPWCIRRDPFSNQWVVEC